MASDSHPGRKGEAASVRIEFRRERDGSVISRYIRSDGTYTWERQKGERALYFPVHDIVHYAVEHALGLDCGFYGLIAQGWDIPQMDGKGLRGRLPGSSIVVEKLVGLFSAEFTSDRCWTADEINAHLAAYAEQSAVAPLRWFSDEEIQAVRYAIREARAAWENTGFGEALRLTFRCPSPATPATARSE